MALSRVQRQKEQEDKRKKDLQLKIIRPGDAIYFPKQFDSCSMHYIGYLADGTMFDNSYNRGQPINFILGGGHVIPGLEQVLPMLSKNEKARVIIPPLATLTYEVELLTFTSSTHLNIQETLQKASMGPDAKRYSPTKKLGAAHGKK